MKKYLFLFILFFSTLFLIAPLQTFAATVSAEGNPNCHCANPDSMAGGANGFTCNAGTTPSQPNCAPNYYCQDTTNGPKCMSGYTNTPGGPLACVSLHSACGGLNGPLCCGIDATCGSDGYCDPTTNNPFTSPPPPPPPPCATPPAGTSGCNSVLTAFGSWNTQPTDFVQTLFGMMLSITGGIAILIIIKSGYQMMLSQGDPEKTAGAKEALTAAIIGLLFLIFSFVILEIIGVDLLHLPGFGK